MNQWSIKAAHLNKGGGAQTKPQTKSEEPTITRRTHGHARCTKKWKGGTPRWTTSAQKLKSKHHNLLLNLLRLKKSLLQSQATAPKSDVVKAAAKVTPITTEKQVGYKTRNNRKTSLR
jgi:hypothetical protein